MKAKSKLIILDAKDKFSKQGLFTAGWKQLYGGMIEWVSGAGGGIVEAIDPKTLVGQVDVRKYAKIQVSVSRCRGRLQE